MRALINTRTGGPDVLRVEERPNPVPQPGQVLIRVERAGLNFSDVAARVGLYPEAPKFPSVLGYEVSGVVDALGAEVTSVKVGARVLALTRFGGQASHVVVSASLVREIPDAMSLDDAAAIPVVYLTAFHMLKYLAPLQPGMTVLIHSIAGGVGLAAVQLCKTVKDITIIGTASASKHEYLKSVGVHHCIDYRTQDYAVEAMRITDGKGVHRVVDSLGGPDWNKGYSILRSGGHLLAFGWANMIDGDKRSLLRVVSQFMGMKRFSPMTMMNDNRTVSGVNLGHLWHEAELLGGHLDQLIALYEAGAVKPRIDSVFALSEAAKAHEHMQARKNVGKVLFDCTK